jgi:hypothetical protein
MEDKKKKVLILNDNAVLGELDHILLEQEKSEQDKTEKEDK